MSVAVSLARLEEEIAAACARAGRDRASVTLIAVTKTHPSSLIREAYQAGIRQVGENRVQEFLAKKAELEDLDLNWHLIGSLQTNKVKSVLPHTGLIHSLDRVDLAEAIARHAIPGGRVPALIQVNTTGERTKSGVSAEGLPELVDRVRGFGEIDLRGFMTIGPLEGSEEEIRGAFALLRGLRDQAAVAHPDLSLPILSMGMSDDFPLAIQEGATHIRIGSRIFGERD